MRARWTIESELVDRSGSEDLAEAAFLLGLLDERSPSVEVTCELDWRPGGAETYIYEFSVVSTLERKRYVLKAVTALDGMGSVGAIADEWVSRRRRLEAQGVSTPRFFGVHKATVLEEHIPFSLADAIVQCPRRAELFKAQCVLLAQRVGQAGFRPRGLFHDLRTRGEDVVMIDFGSDLGPSGGQVNGMASLARLQEYSLAQGWILDDADIAAVMNGKGGSH